MGKRTRIIGGGIVVGAIVVPSSIGVARLTLERRIAGHVDDLLATAAAAEPVTVTAEDVTGQPRSAPPGPDHRAVARGRHACPPSMGLPTLSAL
jgi:hypothetical protein